MFAKLTHKVAVAVVVISLNVAAVLAVGAVFSDTSLLSSPVIADGGLNHDNPDGYPTWAG